MSIKLLDTIYKLTDNSDKLDGKDSSYFHRNHLTSISDLTGEIKSDVVTFDYSSPSNGPGGWINGFVSVHSDYLSSFIVNEHRTDNWNVGWYDRVNGSGSITWRKLIHSGNIGSQSVSYATSAGSVAWGNVSGKPSSFTPSSHTHTKSQITDFAHTHDYAATSHTHTKAQITDFSHTHNYAGSSSAGGTANAAKKLELVSSGITSTTNDTTAKWGPLGSSIHFVTTSGQLINQPSQYGMILNMTNGGAEVAQLWFTQNTGTLYRRQGNGDGWGCNWTAILDSTNYSTWAAAKSHTHDYAASSHNHDSVYSKLGHTHDYAASSHTHDYAIQCGTVPQSGRVSKSGFYETSSATTVTKNHAFSSTYMHFINCQHSNTANNYALQIAASFYDNVNFKIRVTNNSDATTWNTILHNNNWSSYCAAASHTHSYYPLSGNTNMSGDNVWIGSTMAGGTDYWRIGGYGSSDNGICRITIGDNSGDKFQIQIADYTGTTYTPLEVTNNRLNVNGLANISFNSGTLTIGSQNTSYTHYSTTGGAHWFNKDVYAAGNFYGGSSYNRRLAFVDEVALSGHTHSYVSTNIASNLTNTSTVNYANTPYGVNYRNHYSGHGLGSYRGVLTCKDNSVGFELNSYWCVNPADGVGTNNLYYRVKRDAASDWGPYARIIDSGNIGSQSVNYANSSGNANTVDGYHISVGSSAGSDANTIYYIV